VQCSAVQCSAVQPTFRPQTRAPQIIVQLGELLLLLSYQIWFIEVYKSL
jgi:hypothetical protein